MLRLGSLAGSALRLPQAAPVHARLLWRGGRYWARRVDGPLLCDGRVVAEAVALTPGVTLQLGRGGPRLLVEAATEVSADLPADDLDWALARLAADLGEPGLGEGEQPCDLVLGARAATVGRAPGCDLRLPHPCVSAHQATLRPLPDGRHELVHHGHAPTHVDGRPWTRGPLRRGAVIEAGPFAVRYTGRGLRLEARRGRMLEAKALTCRAGGQRLLDEVSLRAEPGKLVAVLGASGSGKSTLLRALAGQLPADAGQVLVDGRVWEDPTAAVALVPQDDVLHRELEVGAQLRYAAELRLSPDLGAEERGAHVAGLLERLGLRALAERPLRQLSGGQRKRVSLALELLTEPGVLLLDEPTAGLDPSLHRKLMGLFHELAAEGRTVVLTTHRLEELDRCDQLVVLAGGRVAFSGAPAAARERFGIEDLGRLYDRLPAAPRATAEVAVLRRPPRAARPRRGPRTLARQASVVARRGLALWLADRRRAGLLLLQAPLLGLCVAAAVEGPAAALFLLVLTALWCGTSAGAREVVKERAVLARERAGGLGALPYLGAKAALLSAFAALQCVLLLGAAAAWAPLPAGFLPLLGALVPVACVGALLGLAVSAQARTPDQASALVPLVLIPQVLLAGALTGSSPLARDLGRLTPARWGYDLALRQAEPGALSDQEEHRAALSAAAARELSARARAVELADRVDGEPLPAPEAAWELEPAWASLDAERERLRRDLAATIERQHAAEARARAITERARELGRAIEDFELDGEWIQVQLDRARDMLSDIRSLRGEAEEATREAEALRERVGQMEAQLERITAAQEELSAGLREGARRAEGLAEAREEAAPLRRELEAAAVERAALEQRVREGRVARFEPLGSPRRDLGALAAFALAFLLLGALGLRSPARGAR
ncbi:MAG: ATP-binding cassette domain-containing protein [Planctomycetota bacterium]